MIEHELSTIAIRDEGILEFRYRDGVYMTLDAARSLVDAATELVGGSAPLPTLVVIGNIRGVTREARDFFSSSEENQRVSSRVALIVSSGVGKMLVNLFQTLSPPVIPSRAFTEESLAVAWLRQDSRPTPRSSRLRL